MFNTKSTRNSLCVMNIANWKRKQVFACKARIYLTSVSYLPNVDKLIYHSFNTELHQLINSQVMFGSNMSIFSFILYLRSYILDHLQQSSCTWVVVFTYIMASEHKATISIWGNKLLSCCMTEDIKLTFAWSISRENHCTSMKIKVEITL